MTIDKGCWFCLLWPWRGDTEATFRARLAANHTFSGGRHVRLSADRLPRLKHGTPADDQKYAPRYYNRYERAS